MILSGVTLVHSLYQLFIIHFLNKFTSLKDWDITNVIIGIIISLVIFVFVYQENRTRRLYWVLILILLNLDPVEYFNNKTIVSFALTLICAVSVFCFYGFYKSYSKS